LSCKVLGTLPEVHGSTHKTSTTFFLKGLPSSILEFTYDKTLVRRLNDMVRFCWALL